MGIIKISNRVLYTFIAIALVIAIIGVGYAYGTSAPVTMGHSAGEIDWGTTGFSIPVKIGTMGRSAECPDSGWGCGLHTWDVWAEASVRTNTLCLGGGLEENGNVGNCKSAWPFSGLCIVQIPFFGDKETKCINEISPAFCSPNFRGKNSKCNCTTGYTLVPLGQWVVGGQSTNYYYTCFKQ